MRRRGDVRGRLRLRRLLDRRLEGHRGVRHDADAGSRQRPHRSVLRPDDDGGVLRRARALHGRDVRARSALHRQARRSLPEADRHRRQRRVRSGSRVLHLRRRALHRRSLQYGLQARQRRAAVQLRHRIRDGQPRPPSAHQGRLLPGAAGRQRPGHPLRDALGDGRDGRGGREASPRGGLRPARARHQVRADGASWPTTCRSTST